MSISHYSRKRAEWQCGIDGTAVIYLVLKSVTVPTAGVREAVRMSLAREKQQQYVRSVEDELLKQADIRVYLQRLPPAARAGLLVRLAAESQVDDRS